MSKDVIAVGLAQLVQQFQEQPKLRAIVSAWLGQVQAMEEVLEQLRTGRGLDGAQGKQLDGIGSIVGLDRGGLNDADYRGRLRVQIRLLRGEGTPEDILSAVSLATGQTGLRLYESRPAEIRLVVGEGIPADTARLVLHLVRTMKSAGVRSWLEWGEAPAAASFSFEGGDGLGFDNGAFRAVRN